MIRLAYIIDSIVSASAGSENQLLKLLHNLDRSDFEPHLITLRDSDWLKQHDLPCPHLNVNLETIVSPGFVSARNRFADYCRSHKIDIAQSFFLDSHIFTALCGRKAGVRAVVAGRRSIGANYWHSARMVRLMRWLTKRTSHYVANSQAVAEETSRVEGVPGQKISVIPNGIDVERFTPPAREQIAAVRQGWGVPDSALVIGATANLRPVKNTHFLIETAEPLIKSHSDLYVVVLGEGQLRPELEHSIDERGLRDRFLLPGSSTTVARDLYAFDIAVLTSHGESLSNAVMEYMSCGRPSVVSDVGGNRELLTSDKVGFLYEPGNHNQFRQAVEQLIADAHLRQSVGNAARESARERFSLGPVVAQWQALYRRLLEENGQAE